MNAIMSSSFPSELMITYLYLHNDGLEGGKEEDIILALTVVKIPANNPSFLLPVCRKLCKYNNKCKSRRRKEKEVDC